MNNFELKFFRKYVPEWDEMLWVVHEHWLKIVDNVLVLFGLLSIIPSFMYFNSIRIQELVPFYALEIYLFCIFLKLVYDIFDRYNDVWIITSSGVVDLDWALFSTDMTTVKYENIEWVEVEQYGILDTLFNKGDIVIHKIGTWEFRLPDAKIPYESLDEIEKFSKMNTASKKDDRFDMVMEALTWVVENYLDTWGAKRKTKNEKYEKKYLKNIEKTEWTIDLRDEH